MRALILAPVIACAAPDPSGERAEAGFDSGAFDSAPDGTDEGEEVPEERHPLGMQALPFSLLDLNPRSSTYGQMVSDRSLVGRPFALIFLDSRCQTCADVTDDVWTTYQDHLGWWEELPTFAVESIRAAQIAPDSVLEMVTGNALPYLQDTKDAGLWLDYQAVNHDLLGFDASHRLETWLPLYTWPDDLPLFQEWLAERTGG